MVTKIIMAVCMLPVLPIMYGAARFIRKEKTGIQYGVTLWEGAEDSPQVQDIRRKEKKGLNRMGLFCLLLFLLTLLPDYESLVIAGQTIWIFLVIVLMYVPYVRAHGRMMEQKREYLASLPQEDREQTGNSVLVDVTAAAAEKPVFFRKTLWSGCLFACFPALAELLLPHEGRTADFWLWEVTLITMGVVTLLFPLFLSVQKRLRTRVFTPNSRINLQIAQIRRYHWSWLCAALAWETGLLNWCMLFAFRAPARWFLPLIITASLLYGLTALALCFYCWSLTEKTSRKYLEQASICREDEDAYWLWGMFYYNKNDNRSMVEARAGMGVTGNMAKPVMKYGTLLIIAALILGMSALCGWVILEEFTPVSLIYEEDVLIAQHWKEAYRIEKQDMEQVTLLEEEPDIRRNSGTGMETLKKGNFYSNRYEQSMSVCLNPEEPPFLLIKTEEGAWYLLGSGDGQETREIYRRLKQ